MVEDGSTPRLSDVSVVKVKVNRNNFPPDFVSKEYTASILEIKQVGVPFKTVTALDSDIFVSTSL